MSSSSPISREIVADINAQESCFYVSNVFILNWKHLKDELVNFSLIFDTLRSENGLILPWVSAIFSPVTFCVPSATCKCPHAYRIKQARCSSPANVQHVCANTRINAIRRHAFHAIFHGVSSMTTRNTHWLRWDPTICDQGQHISYSVCVAVCACAVAPETGSAHANSPIAINICLPTRQARMSSFFFSLLTSDILFTFERCAESAWIWRKNARCALNYWRESNQSKLLLQQHVILRQRQHVAANPCESFHPIQYLATQFQHFHGLN